MCLKYYIVCFVLTMLQYTHAWVEYVYPNRFQTCRFCFSNFFSMPIIAILEKKTCFGDLSRLCVICFVTRYIHLLVYEIGLCLSLQTYYKQLGTSYLGSFLLHRVTFSIIGFVEHGRIFCVTFTDAEHHHLYLIIIMNT